MQTSLGQPIPNMWPGDEHSEVQRKRELGQEYDEYVVSRTLFTSLVGFWSGCLHVHVCFVRSA